MIKHIIIIAIFLSLAAGAGIAYVSYQNTAREQAQIKATEQTKAIAEDQQVRQNFENLLNAFLNTLGDHMQAYKNKRRIIADLVTLENLREPAYISENYTFMSQTIPEMKQDGRDILRLFDVMDKEIGTLIYDGKLKQPEIVLSSWQATKAEQLSFYTDFFALENNVLNSYEALMTFYYRHATEIEIDWERRTAIFNKAQLESQYLALIQDIDTAKNLQKELLQRRNTP